MKIDIVQKIVDTDKCKGLYFESCYNKVTDVNYCCDGAKALFNNGVLAVSYGSCNDSLNDNPDLDEEVPVPFVGIVKTDLVNNGYESFDGEDEYWVDNYEEEYSYYKITKCPICGKEIDINSKVIDVTEDINNYIKILPKGKKSKEDKLKRDYIYKEINAILM